MTRLNNKQILRIWELSKYQHPIDKAITILQKSLPDMSWEELINLSIGKRNSLLLEVKEKTFGSELQGITKCPSCNKELEFTADADEFREKKQIREKRE